MKLETSEEEKITKLLIVNKIDEFIWYYKISYVTKAYLK